MTERLMLVAVILALACVPTVSAAPHGAQAGGATVAGTGTLTLNAELSWQGGDGECPAGTPSGIDCHPHPGGPALVSGLGEVTQQYLYAVVVDPPDPACKAGGGFNLADYPASLIVKGKGELHLWVRGINECLAGPPSDTVVNNTQSFTVTGGSGAYAGASGAGTVTHVAHRDVNGHAVGRDTWGGTLSVPGVDFDVIAPTITGAVDKVVRAPRRAKRIRVSFKVTAQDEVDGALPVACKPRSGSRFRLGKTRVQCSATDSSGNAARVRFMIRVKRRH
jgi:HYR domain